jgi:hypothetical protein
MMTLGPFFTLAGGDLASFGGDVVMWGHGCWKSSLSRLSLLLVVVIMAVRALINKFNLNKQKEKNLPMAPQ